MKDPLSFSVWLRRQNRRQDPVGDLARDFILDAVGRRPHGGPVTFEVVRERLRDIGADRVAFDALARADVEYRSRTEGMGAERHAP